MDNTLTSSTRFMAYLHSPARFLLLPMAAFFIVLYLPFTHISGAHDAARASSAMMAASMLKKSGEQPSETTEAAESTLAAQPEPKPSFEEKLTKVINNFSDLADETVRNGAIAVGMWPQLAEYINGALWNLQTRTEKNPSTEGSILSAPPSVAPATSLPHTTAAHQTGKSESPVSSGNETQETPVSLPLIIFLTICVFGVAWLAELAALKVLHGLRRKLLRGDNESRFGKIAKASGLFMVGFAGIITFALVAVPAAAVAGSTLVPVRFTVSFFMVPVLRLRLFLLIIRLLLIPHAGHLRLFPMGDAAAAHIKKWLYAIFTFTVITDTAVMLLAANGLPKQLASLLLSIVLCFSVSGILYLIFYYRGPVREHIYHATGNPELAIAANWHWLAGFYVVVLSVLRIISYINLSPNQQNAILLSFIALPVATLLDSIAGMTLGSKPAAPETALQNMPESNREEEPSAPAEPLGLQSAVLTSPEVATEEQKTEHDAAADVPEQTAENATEAQRHLRTAHKLLRVMLVLSLVFFLLHVWGIELPVGMKFTKAVFSIFITMTLGFLCWEYFRSVIDRKLKDEHGDGAAHNDDGGGAGGSRKATLLTLLRKLLLITICTTSLFIILSGLGIDIGPLLAGAGIVGLAIGFGSQTLVKDILSGVFFLLDDAFRIGDYVDTGTHRGNVEHISIRALRLRHPRGAIHIIPYGSLKSLTNFSRDWCIMKLRFHVTHDTDPKEIKKIAKGINAAIREDENLGKLLLEDVKSQGVREIDETGLLMRIKFKTIPGGQFQIRKQVLTMLRREFEKRGIRFASKRVSVHIPELDSRNIEDLPPKAIAAATEAALEEEQEKTKHKDEGR
ncbi:mechanosensitive ion channel domain-containing protein [Oleidesulfovibrio sp.]|uniref:mechanosensitive ion channel domain-containing protein n=1 Tax=Oleidesulfovibrio sp. TaxID=2909707 RepID=UPI003A89F8B8